MRRLFAVPVGALALALVTSLERLPSLESVRTDPCAILITYLAFRSDVVGGALSALLLGFILDVTSGSATGLHMLSLMLLFVVLRVVANAVQLPPGIKLLPVAIAAGLGHAALVGFMVSVFSDASFRLAGVWQSSLPSVLGNAVLGALLLLAVDGIAQRVDPEADHLFLK